jgi:hypothetical protein
VANEAAGMRLSPVIQIRKRRPWAILVVLAIVGMLIVTLAWLSSRFSLEDLYGILD